MGNFEKILNEVKKLNQARRYNNALNKDNKALAEANSFTIRTKLQELQKLK